MIYEIQYLIKGITYNQASIVKLEATLDMQIAFLFLIMRELSYNNLTEFIRTTLFGIIMRNSVREGTVTTRRALRAPLAFAGPTECDTKRL